MNIIYVREDGTITDENDPTGFGYVDESVTKELYEALEEVHRLIVDASFTGFNPKSGDWAEKLYESQSNTFNAFKKARGAI